MRNPLGLQQYSNETIRSIKRQAHARGFAECREAAAALCEQLERASCSAGFAGDRIRTLKPKEGES